MNFVNHAESIAKVKTNYEKVAGTTCGGEVQVVLAGVVLDRVGKEQEKEVPPGVKEGGVFKKPKTGEGVLKRTMQQAASSWGFTALFNPPHQHLSHLWFRDFVFEDINVFF